MGVVTLRALWLEFSAVSDYFRCGLFGGIDFAALEEMSVQIPVRIEVNRYNAKYHAPRWVGSII